VPEAHEARVELGRADRLKPEMPETFYSLGKAASLTGETSVAEAAWTKLINIENQSALAAQAHFGLAGLYRKQGKRRRLSVKCRNSENCRPTRRLRKNKNPQPQMARELGVCVLL
jgi:hypothetical protein